MKRIRNIFLAAALLLLTTQHFQAHPGKLDKYGGHCDHKKKEYHFHRNGKIYGRSKDLYRKRCTGGTGSQFFRDNKCRPRTDCN